MEIMKTIATPMGELALWLEETYQVEIKDTMEKWHELTGMNITVQDDVVSHDKVDSIDVKTVKTVKSAKKIPKTKDVCQHIFMSGKNVGEQCTTKPKNGALFCSAHRPKDSVKSAKSAKASKAPKKVKKTEDKIASDFASDSEKEDKPDKVAKAPKKATKKVVKKATHDSDDSDNGLSEPEVPVKPLLKKKATHESDDSDNDLSEPEVPVKPLLKKSKEVKKTTKKPYYDTDDEPIDTNLNLSEDEE